MDPRLIVDASRIDPEGETLSGEVDCVDIDENLVKAFGGLRYELDLQVLGSELLARGRLAQDFTVVCSRCGKDFDCTIREDAFTASFAIGEKNAEVDLTDELRESIILNLPSYPVCDETCPGVERKAAMPADDRWSVLDNLKQ